MSSESTQQSARELALTQEEIRALKWFVKLLRGVTALIKGGGAGNANGAAAGAPGQPQPPAPASELDSRFGNPTVRKDPKRWAGPSYIGARYSECPTDYLIETAESYEYFAAKDAQKPDARKHEKSGKFWWELNLKDAARARGWAARNRGKSLPPPVQRPAAVDDEEIPIQTPNDPDDWEPAQ